ncbi:MAG: hypothetical protein ACRYFX_18525 [Janthinobacterium lividum]
MPTAPALTIYPETVTVDGETLVQAGIGAYPYECRAKDKYPTAMVYKGPNSWLHSANPLHRHLFVA